jgi:hypothetical protein
MGLVILVLPDPVRELSPLILGRVPMPAVNVVQE